MSSEKSISGPRLLLAGVVNRLLGGGWWTDAKALFVLSTGRTGTETLTELLTVSEEVLAFHEPPPQLIEERQKAFFDIESDPQPFDRIFRTSRCRQVAAAKLLGRVYAETSARMTFFAPVIHQIMPRAKFIHLYRHPGDVVRSGMRRGWYEGHPGDQFRITPPRGTEAFDLWTQWSRFEKICWYWSAYHEFSLRFIATADPQRILHVNSDDMFNPDSGTWKSIFQLIEVPEPSEQLVRKSLAVRHNAQQGGDFPRFAEWTMEQKQSLARIAGETMAKLQLPSPVADQSVPT